MLDRPAGAEVLPTGAHQHRVHGHGRTLLNYAEVLRSAERISAEDGLGMSPRRLTVSTAGIAKMIRRLADDDAKFNLALSLHAANDAKRGRIMPINEQNDLATLKDALRYYTALQESPSPSSTCCCAASTTGWTMRGNS